MGLIRGMARTAVVAGSATAVSNRVSRRQANKWQQQSDADAYQQQQSAPPPPQYAQPQYAQPAPQYAPPAPAYAEPPAPAPVDDLTDQLQKLANLKNQGILTEEEFTAAKARLLNS
jgi:hypothetical protein